MTYSDIALIVAAIAEFIAAVAALITAFRGTP
jgi:hypothetical protein